MHELIFTFTQLIHFMITTQINLLKFHTARKTREREIIFTHENIENIKSRCNNREEFMRLGTYDSHGQLKRSVPSPALFPFLGIMRFK